MVKDLFLKSGFDAAFSSNAAIPVRACECHCTTSNGCVLLAAHCVCVWGGEGYECAWMHVVCLSLSPPSAIVA